MADSLQRIIDIPREAEELPPDGYFVVDIQGGYTHKLKASTLLSGLLARSESGAAGRGLLAAETVSEALTAIGTPLAANTMQIDNADGTGRQARTFPEVRAALTAPVYALDMAALRSLDRSKDRIAYLAAAGRSGYFAARTENLSTRVLGGIVNVVVHDAADGVVGAPAHGLRTAMTVIVTSAVNGLTTNTIYFVIAVDADQIKFASSYQNAWAGTAINLTGSANFAIRRHFDPTEGWFVMPATDKTGASGGWERINQPTVEIEHFGAVRGVASAREMQAALYFAERFIGAVHFSGGASVWSAERDLFVPVGSGADKSTVEIYGDGWNNTTVVFTAAASRGFWQRGQGTYEYAGTIRDICVHGNQAALGGVTCENVNHPRLVRVQVRNVQGAGIRILGALMSTLDHCLVRGCGSADEGSIKVDGSPLETTTLLWLHTRISGSQANALCGLQLDDADTTTIIGGTIESTKTLILASSLPGRTHGCRSGTVIGLGLENPGNGNPMISFGDGWTGQAGQAASSWVFEGLKTSGSGTTTMPCVVYLKNTHSMRFGPGNYSPNGGGAGTAATAIFLLEGTTNSGVEIEGGSVNAGSYNVPWVVENGVQRKDASPLTKFRQDTVSPGLEGQPSRSGSSISCLIYPAQGGWYSTLYIVNNAATDLATLTGGVRGMTVRLIATNGNTTIKHGTGADQFHTRGGADFTMQAHLPYRFYYNGSRWFQE